MPTIFYPLPEWGKKKPQEKKYPTVVNKSAWKADYPMLSTL